MAYLSNNCDAKLYPTVPASKLEPKKNLSINTNNIGGALVVLRFCYTTCRNCVGTIRAIVETAVETVVNYIETVACSLKSSDFFPQIIISTVPTKTQQLLQRFLQ